MNAKISVLMPSYNHARFIESAVRSILSQTYPDFELIIVDDGSSDNSREIIANFSDPRIRVRLLERNVGACEAMNAALSMSEGKYIAVCNSDDEWNPKKLELQNAFLDQNPEVSAVFSDVIWINDDGQVLGVFDTPYFSVFKQRNRSRWNWLRDLLEGGNCLCHPSVLIRRDVYDRVGPYDNRLRQLPDLYMWTKVVQCGDIFVMPDRLVAFRVHSTNTSASSPTSDARSINEHALIVRETFASISLANFVRAFGLKNLSTDDGLQLEIEKALYLLEHKGLYRSIFRELGLEALYALMRSAQAKEMLAGRYNFDALELHKKAGESSIWLPWSAHSASDPYEAVYGIRTIFLARIVLERLRRRLKLILTGSGWG